MVALVFNMPSSATYWSPGTNDGFGSVSFGSPVTIRCRWQDKNDMFRDGQGKQAVSSAVVYVDRTLQNAGYLYLGISSAADPRTVTGALEIRAVGRSPSLKGNRDLNKVWL